MRIERGSVEKQYAWMYGSIIKFSPAGGAVWFPRDSANDAYAFEGEPTLPAEMPTVMVQTGYGEQGKIKPAELQGARWFRYGCSYILDMHPATSWRCHCTSTDFDVDGFGRCFYTDQGRFCVVVLDGAGNEIARFGSYGNQDACGEESFVLDPAGKFLRPRKADDPADLPRPLAGPDVPFNLFTGLAVTGGHVYVADGGHRRVVRLEKTYAAAAVCEVR
ncbi:MAG: hypothetical protein AMS14_10040 [Planctomycetes bacterium DG_20]|nr:MAG: hypothetical protein AMS14_10040 [Planctomycetes bacterium DG_20]